jgi:hypothetical protein
MNHIVPSNICSAFAPSGVIGSKVSNQAEFLRVLHAAVATHDFSADRIPGQGFIQIPEAIPFVSAGVGKPRLNPEDYVLREYRGRVSAFLKREFAASVEGCAAVVYTMQAYLADPDVTPDEVKRITTESLLQAEDVASKDVYVLVAVLAVAGPSSQLGPHRFTANLAGGNKEAQVWTADEIRAKAREIMAYENEWATVADPV